VRDWTAPRVARLPRVGSRLGLDLADAARARGVDVLKTSGTPTSPPPAHVLEAASRAALENGVAPSQGLPELRSAIAAKLARDNGIHADAATEILVTNGAQHALFLTLLGVLEAGDEVVVPTPTYFVDALIDLAGARAIPVPLDPSPGYPIDAGRIRRAISGRTRALLLVNPGNPTGHVATADELSAVADLAIERDLLVIVDESYERIVYDGRSHVSIGADARLAGRVVTIQSCSKTYALAGWRVGYLAGPPGVVAQLRKLLEWNALGCDYVSQHAALAALRGPQGWTETIRDDFRANRDRLVDELLGLEEMPFVVPEGNPNLFPDVGRLGADATAVAAYLLERHGVRVTPGEYFQAPGHVRLEFGGAPEVVVEVGRRLRQAVRELALAGRVVTG
jgi:aspartate/methionine/tyrosine aminotransferase